MRVLKDGVNDVEPRDNIGSRGALAHQLRRELVGRTNGAPELGERLVVEEALSDESCDLVFDVPNDRLVNLDQNVR